MRPELGVCQWFHYLDHESVERAVDLLSELGVRHLRTGISWADFHRPQGQEWYDWQMRQLSRFDVLLSIWHTPPSISEGGCCNSPPRRLRDYADFVRQVHGRYGYAFTALELWNEPNNLMKWNFRDHDPDWRKFAAMTAMAAAEARRCGLRTVLGGMIPVDPAWLRLVGTDGALRDVESVAFHAFPEMWWPDYPNWDWHRDWKGWRQKVAKLARAAGGRSIWVTETGLATWDVHGGKPSRFEMQARMLERASRAPVERVYWYSLMDLDPRREALDGFHVDENHYHMGLVAADGTRKPAFRAMQRLARERHAAAFVRPPAPASPRRACEAREAAQGEGAAFFAHGRDAAGCAGRR